MAGQIVSPDRLALIRSLMGATWPHNILGKWGEVAPSENPEEQPIFIPEKPEPIPANDTWQEEDESRFPPVERALRSEVRALLSRFDGLPSSTTGEEEYTFTIQPVSFNLMSGVAKLTDSPVISNIYIRDEAVNWTKPDGEKQTEQDNANHATPKSGGGYHIFIILNWAFLPHFWNLNMRPRHLQMMSRNSQWSVPPPLLHCRRLLIVSVV